MFYRISQVLLFGVSLMLWLMAPELGRTAGFPQDADEQETDIFELLDEEPVEESAATTPAAEPAEVAEDAEPVEDAAVTEDAGALDTDAATEDEIPFSDEELDEAFGTAPVTDGDLTDDLADDLTEDATADAVATDDTAAKPVEPATIPADLKFEPMEKIPAPVAIPARPVTPWQGQVRQYAPGVVRQIPGRLDPKDSVTRYDLVLPELAGGPDDLGWMKDVPLRRELWMLEFRFKPVGMLDVDIPQPNGQVERKKIWYLVYSVKNTGNVVVPEQGEDLTWSLKPSAKSVRFFPRFVLESTNVHKLYRDRVIPVAVDAIQRREGTRLRLLNTVEAVREIAPGEEIWGVATWDAVDPMTHRFSVYVQGLTNAYIWNQQTDANGGVELTAGRTYRRTLKLNFLRRGDQYMIREEQILYGTTGGLDHEWVYR